MFFIAICVGCLCDGKMDVRRCDRELLNKGELDGKCFFLVWKSFVYVCV